MSKYVLVETISQFRMRYVIEVPDDHNEREIPCTAVQWAEDTVTCEEMVEFSQKFIGDAIIDSRELNLEEVLKMCDLDNAYCQSWTDEHKLKTFVTPIDYKRDF
jgi:hypothetical protein